MLSRKLTVRLAASNSMDQRRSFLLVLACAFCCLVGAQGDGPLSCESVGCGNSNPHGRCSCDSACITRPRVDCCFDYTTLCVEPPTVPSLCSDRPAGEQCVRSTNPFHTCQCGPDCTSHRVEPDKCCPDYVSLCTNPTASPAPNATNQTTAPATVGSTATARPTTPLATAPPRTLCANEGCMFSDPLAACRCDHACKLVTNDD
eukprot:scpid94591/ scgid19932/ 